MEVIVETRHPEGHALRSVAERRLRFVLRRLAWRIPRVTLRLADTNGTRGGEDKEVQVTLQLPGSRPLLASARARDWHAALDGALERASQRLLRTLNRSRARLHERSRPEPLPT